MFSFFLVFSHLLSPSLAPSPRKRVPFSYESLYGYLLAFSIQLPCFYCTLLATTCSFSVFMMSICALTAFADDIKMQSSSLTNKNATKKSLATYRIELRTFVDLHTKVLQLSGTVTWNDDRKFRTLFQNVSIFFIFPNFSLFSIFSSLNLDSFVMF